MSEFKYNAYRNGIKYFFCFTTAVLALGLGIRSCRLSSEKSVLERKLEELKTVKTEVFITRYLEKNPEKLKTYLPAFVKVAREKGYLADLLNDMKESDRRSLMYDLARKEKDTFFKEIFKDFEFTLSNESYLLTYRKMLEAKNDRANE